MSSYTEAEIIEAVALHKERINNAYRNCKNELDREILIYKRSCQRLESNFDFGTMWDIYENYPDFTKALAKYSDTATRRSTVPEHRQAYLCYLQMKYSIYKEHQPPNTPDALLRERETATLALATQALAQN